MKRDMWKCVSHGAASLLSLVKQCSGASVRQSMHLSTAHLRCVGGKQMDRYRSSWWMRRWGGERRSWVEKERRRRKKERHGGGARVQGRSSSCQGIDVSLQLSSVTSATKSPSNCLPLPKHLAKTQLMSTDVVSQRLLIALSADRLVRQGRWRHNKEKRREEEEEMGTCNRMGIIAPISPRVYVWPRVINSTACNWAQQCLSSSVYPTHQFNYDS